MAAANTDKFKKLSRRWIGQIGAAGVSDSSVATIPLSSTTNLATDTAVVAVIDRVDANGGATPTLEETVIGVVSGNNLVTCTRGVEGTAQSHLAGAVVEILVTAKGYNDIIDGILVDHKQDGTHKSGLALTSPILSTPVMTGVPTGTSFDSILPWNLTINPLFTTSVVQGTWGIVNDSQFFWGGYFLNSPEAINDEITYKVILAAGTYKFTYFGVTNTDQGVITVTLGGVTAGTIDLYTGTVARNITKTLTGIVIPTTGAQTLDIKVTSKNASSSSYVVRITAMNLTRTA